MKIGWPYLLCCMILTSSCNTPEDYFKRPKIDPTILNGDGTGYKAGVLVEDTTNFLAVDSYEYLELEEYIDDLEYRLFICLKYPKRCR